MSLKETTTKSGLPKADEKNGEDLPEELQKLIKLEIDTLHPSWFKALEAQFKLPYFSKVRALLAPSNNSA